MEIYERISVSRETGLKFKKKKLPPPFIELARTQFSRALQVFSNPFEGECFTVVLSVQWTRKDLPNLGNSVDCLMQKALPGVLNLRVCSTTASLSELQLLNYGQSTCIQSFFQNSRRVQQ